jgi:hypothetical protein
MSAFAPHRKLSNLCGQLGCGIARQLMQEHAVSDQVDQAVAVSRIMREPNELQIELAQEDVLGRHHTADGQAPAMSHLLKVLGWRPILLPALRHDLGSLLQDAEAIFRNVIPHPS